MVAAHICLAPDGGLHFSVTRGLSTKFSFRYIFFPLIDTHYSALVHYAPVETATAAGRSESHTTIIHPAESRQTRASFPYYSNTDNNLITIIVICRALITHVAHARTCVTVYTHFTYIFLRLVQGRPTCNLVLDIYQTIFV